MMEILIAFFLDPVVTRAIGATLSIVLLFGALQKLRDPVVFAGAVENYRLLPDALLPVAAHGLPLLELAAGVLLLFPETCLLGGGWPCCCS
ncbi:MauE/DoxX family redox-associated membrane protein [Dechloromonas sp. A34]|uniref:MauE/DoxX family redox-associated membrane protein n=1 Tax=Dechloromonas sp. A34 TaxID=447588 RepID=UPI002248CA4E|nr:MauE/DoxX family redox-associated membrane protein [Dechloromonas sp. A34]